jgi:hypothetical protein
MSGSDLRIDNIYVQHTFGESILEYFARGGISK